MIFYDFVTFQSYKILAHNIYLLKYYIIIEFTTLYMYNIWKNYHQYPSLRRKTRYIIDTLINFFSYVVFKNDRHF